MRPKESELDEEIRAHLALAIQDRIDRGEDPEAARSAAYREFGYIPAAREQMRRVWYGRCYDAAAGFAREVRSETLLVCVRLRAKRCLGRMRVPAAGRVPLPHRGCREAVIHKGPK